MFILIESGDSRVHVTNFNFTAVWSIINSRVELGSSFWIDSRIHLLIHVHDYNYPFVLIKVSLFFSFFLRVGFFT